MARDYMNNPFDRPMVERIALALEESARKHPREIRVVYVNAAAPDVFATEPWFHVGSSPGGDVFALRLPVAGAAQGLPQHHRQGCRVRREPCAGRR